MFCVAMMFSFGGTCAKLISPYFSCWFISFFRFAVGVLFLLLLKVLLRKKKRHDREALKQCGKWLLIGALAKCAAYMTENYGLTHGVSYGNIVTMPAQTIFVTLVSVVALREKMGWKKILGVVLCILGVLCISWNGRAFSDYFGPSSFLTLLFVASGMFAGLHVIAQKMVADRMDNVDSNLMMFSMAAVFAMIPLVPETASGALAGVSPNLPCILAITGFGFITGIGFYLNGKAMTMIPLYMVPVLQSTMVIFTLLWGIWFWHETVTVYTVVGALIFLVGILRLQIGK